MTVIHLLISCTSSMACWLHVIHDPAVSIATGKRCACFQLKSLILCSLVVCCLFGCQSLLSCSGAHMELGKSIGNSDIPSHRFLFGPGIRVAPSGRLPSLLRRLAGSFTAWICALLTALHIILFMWQFRCQAKPCKPQVSSVLPQTQM